MKIQVNWSKVILLTEQNVIDNTKDQAGIYRLSFKDEKDELTVFYVGQTTEIQTRLLQHLSDSESNRCIKSIVNSEKCYFRFAYVSSQQNRDCAERFLYEHFNKPRCNIQEPQSEPCEINVK